MKAGLQLSAQVLKMSLRYIFFLLELLKEQVSGIVKHPLESPGYQWQSNLSLQQIHFFSNKKQNFTSLRLQKQDAT